MKRIASILLLFALSLQLGGFYTYYAFRLSQIRSEMRYELTRMPLDQLEKFSLSIEEYENIKVGEDEIEVSNRMYDIASIQLTADSVYIYCLHDEAEDDLIAFMGEILYRVHTDDQPVHGSVLQLLTLEYLVDSCKICILALAHQLRESNYAFYALSIDKAIAIPPPK